MRVLSENVDSLTVSRSQAEAQRPRTAELLSDPKISPPPLDLQLPCDSWEGELGGREWEERGLVWEPLLSVLKSGQSQANQPGQRITLAGEALLTSSHNFPAPLP